MYQQDWVLCFRNKIAGIQKLHQCGICLKIKPFLHSSTTTTSRASCWYWPGPCFPKNRKHSVCTSKQNCMAGTLHTVETELLLRSWERLCQNSELCSKIANCFGILKIAPHFMIVQFWWRQLLQLWTASDSACVCSHLGYNHYYYRFSKV